MPPSSAAWPTAPSVAHGASPSTTPSRQAADPQQAAAASTKVTESLAAQADSPSPPTAYKPSSPSAPTTTTPSLPKGCAVQRNPPFPPPTSDPPLTPPPSGYYKFTTAIQSQTPCFSNLRAKITPPPLTAGLAAIPTDTRLPTSAILNVAWAMGYNVSDPDANKPPLSKPAAIGVGVGAGVVALLLLGLTAWVCMRVRKKKKAAVAAAPTAGGTGTGGEKYTDSAPVAGPVYGKGYQSPPPPVSPASGSPHMGSVGAVSPSGSPPPGAYAAGDYGQHHARQFSDASSTGDWTIASGQGLVPGQQGQGGPYAPPLPMQYQDRYGGQQQVSELQEGYGQQREYGYQGSPSPPLGQQQQQEYQQQYSELPPQEYQGPQVGGGQQQGQYDGRR